MDIEAVPPLDGSGQRAVIEALERVGVRVQNAPEVYGNAWRAAGLREGAETDAADDYALSPRSTRGATRA